MEKPSPVPLLLATAFAAVFWFTDNVAASIAQLFGQELVSLTVPHLLAAVISGALAMAVFESGKLSDLGLHWNAGAGRNLLAGVAAGVAGASLVVLPPVAIGLAHF